MFSKCAGKDSWESLGLQGDQTSQSFRKSVLNIHWRTDAEAEAPILWPPDAKNWLIRKDPDTGKDWRQKEKGAIEDEMVRWHHRLDGHEFKQAPGVGDGQGSLVCCGPWGYKELDMTERLNWTELNWRCSEESYLRFLHQRPCKPLGHPYWQISLRLLPIQFPPPP